MGNTGSKWKSPPCGNSVPAGSIITASAGRAADLRELNTLTLSVPLLFWRIQIDVETLTAIQATVLLFSWHNRDHYRFAGIVPLKCPFHFPIIAIVRCKEVWTNKKENDVIRLDVIVDCPRPIITGTNPAIVPGLDDALPLEHGKLSLQLVPQRFISV